MTDSPQEPQPPTIEQHEAVDRFGKAALRTAHDLGAALAETGHAEPGEPVVVRTGGPHRSLDGLAALIDAALEENSEGPRETPDARPGDGGDRSPGRG